MSGSTRLRRQSIIAGLLTFVGALLLGLAFDRWYGQALMSGATVDDVKKWPERIRAVTAAQVKDAAVKWLDMKRSVTGYLVKEAAPAVNKAEQAPPAKSGSTGEKRS